jgi:arylsulfatase A-like enzyme
MRVKTIILCSALLVALLAAGYYFVLRKRQAPPAQDPARRYNVVMIVSDALRQDVLGCYGGEARTPNIDALAGRGVLFENAYSTSPWTTPSSVSMFTGNYAGTYGCTPPYQASGQTPMQIFVPHSELLFVEVLRQLGYVATAAIENVNASIHNNLQGFAPLMAPESFDEAVPEQARNEIMTIAGADPPASKAYENAFVVLSYALSIPPTESFFLLHWILDPHYPYQPVEKFRSRMGMDASKLPKDTSYYENIVGTMKLSPDEQRYVKKLYIAEVESVDERVGYFMKTLQHAGLLDRTYVVFTSDHGEQFGDHGLYGHGGFGRDCHYYEGLMRVPLIIVGPNIPADTRVRENVSLLGLMPTMEDLLGVNYRNDMQGTSFAPLIFGESRQEGPLYFDDVQEHVQVDALLDGSYKLICLSDGTFELYDVSADPEEDRSLAPSQAERVQSMFETVRKIREANRARKKRSIAAIDDSLDMLSESEKQLIMEHLRSLGYVK